MLVNYTYAATRKSSGGKVPVARRATLLRARTVAAQALYKAGALLIHSHVAMRRANCLNALLSERKLWMYAAPGAKGKPLRWPVKRHFQALVCKPGAGYLWNIFWHKRKPDIVALRVHLGCNFSRLCKLRPEHAPAVSECEPQNLQAHGPYFLPRFRRSVYQ